MAIYDINGNVLSEGTRIQSYYETEMDDTIAKVRSVSDQPSLVFTMATDIHRYKAATQTFTDMVHNMTYFAKNVKCDFVTITGDTIEGDTDKITAIRYAHEDMKAFQDIGVPILYAQGNHDNNIYSGNANTDKLSIYNVFQTFFSKTRGVTYNFAENGTDYYIDYPLGVRVIVLNACNVKNANNYAYGSGTASWLETVLNTDRTVLLLEHLSSIASQVWNNNHGTYADGVTSALTTFVNGGGHLVQLSGHSHVDIAFIKPWLSVMMVCQKFEVANPNSENMSKISGYIDVITAPSRTANTYTADAWTACVLKPNSYELDCIRFGGGNDRYFHYNAIAPTTLTSRLTGVTWSSSDTSIATVADGVVTGVASGTCGILAKDSTGNYEAWTIRVT